MENIIAQLFSVRDSAHRIHLKVRSFAQHMALGDLYEAVVDIADELAEVYQGKYGIMNIPNTATLFDESSPQVFIKEVASWAETTKEAINPADTHLRNEWDNLLSTIYRAKYKLENLA